jgi:3'(2'), 5'-bisphosphate nucleotidase
LPSLSAELDVAKGLARAAGKRILEHYVKGFAVEFKGPDEADPVTQADKDANQIIVEGLARAFPGDGILAEESELDADRHRYRRLWCIDPLDGTREFIDKNGQFAVMIGLAIDGEAQLGVVLRPTEDALFYGAQGAAFVERAGGTKPLRVSATTSPKDAVMMVSRSHRSTTVTRVAQAMGVEREQPLGSVGLKVVQIAEANAELYLSVSTSTREWDACAPEAILRAAGGVMTDCKGNPLRYNKPTTETPFGLLASNGPLHPACLDALRPVTRERGW